MNYKIIDNALPEDEFKNIRKHIYHVDFPWNCSYKVTKSVENLPLNASLYFCNVFWEGFVVKPEAQIFAPILKLIDCKAVIRIKANLYPSTNKIFDHEDHADYDYPHKGAIFYLNTNDGFTILENNIKIESVENRILLFDPSKVHRSTTCTNKQSRVNVNFNFF
jgi:hypothetical protein